MNTPVSASSLADVKVGDVVMISTRPGFWRRLAMRVFPGRFAAPTQSFVVTAVSAE